MALVRNTTDEVLRLAGGRSLKPGVEAPVDVTVEPNASLLTAGDLELVDVDDAPRVPTARLVAQASQPVPEVGQTLIWAEVDEDGNFLDLKAVTRT